MGDDPKRIYIANDNHTDLFWSASDVVYEQAFLDMLDYYVDRAAVTDPQPSEYQSRFSADGSYWMWVYEQNRTAAEFQELIDRVESGHIKIPLTPLVTSQGGMPAESVLRGMYYAGSVEREYDVRFEMAEACENPTYSLGLASLWAGSGAKYSWGGNWGGDTRIPRSELDSRDQEIFWWTGLDGRKLLIKWPSFVDGDHVGGYAEARGQYPQERPDISVNYVDTDPAYQARYPYQVIGLFGYGHDDVKTTGVHFETHAENLTTADRQVISSNMVDFFKDFETWYGSQIPQVTASYGNEWDLYVATLAELSARVKRSTEQLRGAEAMATLVSLESPAFMVDREAAREQAWMNLGLYAEHDINMAWKSPAEKQSRLDWQRQLVDEIEAYVGTLHNDARDGLGALIQGTGTNPRVFAFNPLSWSRTDVLDYPFSGSGPVHVIDLSTSQETPSQIVDLDGQTYLRILAPDVPSVGYKVFEIRQGAGQTFSDAATVNGNVVENDFYRITVADDGAITSLIDKTRGNREFIQPAGGRYVNDLGTGTGTLSLENVGPVSVTLKAVGSSPLAHTTRITLLRDSDRIDIKNEITENFDATNTWNFSFNLDAPDVWHEETGTVLNAREASQGGHYADRSARVDWLTLNHFADMTGSDGVGVTLSNADAYFAKLGNSGYLDIDEATPQLQVLAGGRVGGNQGFGIENQGGDDYFLQRFALRTHDAFNETDAMQFSLAHQNPLIAGEITGNGASPYPEHTYSFLTISDPNVLLWALKPAEDGIEESGIVARVWNTADLPASFSLTLTDDSIANASELTHIETPIGLATVTEGSLMGTAPQHGLQTYGMMPASLRNNPTGGDGGVTTVEDTAYSFAAGDFPFDDLDGDAFAGIRMVTVETRGDLEYDGTDVAAGTEASDVTKLVFTPAAGESGSPYATFTFKVLDSSGAVSDSAYTMTVNVMASGASIVDDGDPGFSIAGDWTHYQGNGLGYDNDGYYSYKGTGADVATWTFPVVRGTYQVAATWLPYVNRSTDSPYRIYDGSAEVATVRVDQRYAPDDFTDPEHGGTWEVLGEFEVLSGTLAVTLSDDANRYVIADAVRIVRVRDVDLVRITESDDSTDVDEDGNPSDAYQVALLEQPTADVMVTVTADHQLTVDKTSLTFTPSDWDLPQTVTVHGRDDRLPEDPVHGGTITHAASSDDPLFAATAVRDVTAHVADNDVTIVDNGDAGFSTSGPWGSYTGHGLGFDDDCTLDWAGDGSDTATWTFSVEPGWYHVAATWRAFVNRAENAPYRVFDGSTDLATIRVDQRVAPDDFIDVHYGGTWERLGTFEITGDTLVVTLSDDVGYGWKCVVADAIRIETIPVPVIETAGSTAVGVGALSDAYGIVLAMEPAHDVQITLAPTGPIQVDPPTLTFAPGNWNVPQTVTVTIEASGWPWPDTASIAQTASSDDAHYDGIPIPDLPVHLVKTGIADDGDSGFATTGTWDSYQGPALGFGGDCSLSWAGGTSDVATWTLAVLPGTYEVAATWLPFVNRAVNAPYQVRDGSTELATVRVDQQVAPDDFASAGVSWERLGQFEVTGTTLNVSLSDDVGGGWQCVVADAIRVERTGDLSGGGTASDGGAAGGSPVGVGFDLEDASQLAAVAEALRPTQTGDDDLLAAVVPGSSESSQRAPIPSRGDTRRASRWEDSLAAHLARFVEADSGRWRNAERGHLDLLDWLFQTELDWRSL